MRAAVIRRPGGPDVLAIDDVPQPRPGSDEVLVRVRACGLNRADLLQRMGKYPPPADVPQDIPGLEFAGEIAEVGSSSTQWRTGQRVFGIVGGGAQAEYLCTHKDLVAEVPQELSWSEAAAVPEVFMTAYDALMQAAVARGEQVLIHAIGSGVGLAAVQLCGTFGCKSYGTSRTQDKIERAAAYGLQNGFLVRDLSALQGLRTWSQERTQNHGFDVILDLNGGPYFAASLPALALKGRMVLIGTVAGSTTEIDLRVILSRRLHVIGTVLRARPLQEKMALTAAFAKDVVPLFATGKLKAVIDQEFSLAEIRAAHRRLESNESFGKVVLLV